MIFNIEHISDPFLEEVYEESMKELNDFYGFDWKYGRPRILIIPNRDTFDVWSGKKTECWNTGSSTGPVNVLLDRNNYEKESCKKYNEDNYKASLKHELCHSFYHQLSGIVSNKPLWLLEGVAIYTSGQNKFNKRPEKFVNFLEFYDIGGKGVYEESGFVVMFLVDKFGKEKLLELIRSLRVVFTKEDFSKKFKEIYGLELMYESFNNYL